MSRTQSQGVDYFPMAIDFFSDRKIKILKARYGDSGVLLCIDIFCQIYREGFYTRVDEDFYYLLSEDHNMSPDTVEQVMTFLLKRSMFDEQLFKSDAILTSTGIQERWQRAVATRASKTPIEVDARYWLLPKDKTRPFIKVTQNCPSSEKKADNSEKKADNSENYSQYKGNENIIPPFLPPRGEEENPKSLFFKEFPKLRLGRRDDSKVNYKLLLTEFKQSSFLQNGYFSMSWVLMHYDEIIAGKFKNQNNESDDYEARKRWYEERRLKAETTADRARAKAEEDEIFKGLDSEVRKLTINVGLLSATDEAAAAELEKELNEAIRKRDARLSELGLDIEAHYYCEKCKDTGFLPNGKPCDCYNKLCGAR